MSPQSCYYRSPADGCILKMLRSYLGVLFPLDYLSILQPLRQLELAGLKGIWVSSYYRKTRKICLQLLKVNSIIYQSLA